MLYEDSQQTRNIKEISYLDKGPQLWAYMICTPPNLYLEILILVLQDVTAFGDRVFKEVNKVKGVTGWVPTQYDECSYKRGRLGYTYPEGRPLEDIENGHP